MSVAPMLPPEIVPSTVRGPREAVVIPFPSVRPSEPARPAAWPLARPRRIVRPARQPRSAGPHRYGPGAAERRPAGLSRPGLRPAGLRLTRRGRLVVASAALLAVVAFGWLGARLVHARATIPPSAPAVVEVQSGETVWSIARRVAPRADIRAVVDAIVARNGLVGGAVHPGQRLVIRP